jgi:hypothetical protein
MNKVILLASMFLSLNLWAIDLKVGDVLLQPLNCWSCVLIEAQEETIYSHVALIIQTEPSVLVAEALGKVKTVSLEEFKSRTEPGQRISVRRFRDPKTTGAIHHHKTALKKYFDRFFTDLNYDHDFRWDNLDEAGKEKMYCSEFVAKILSGFLRIEASVKRMRFDKNREAWIRFFRGTPPDDEWGNSPGDFERSELFITVGEL